MKELKEMTREELLTLKAEIESLLAASSQGNKVLVELSYHQYKGTGKCWAAQVAPDTKKILGFVDAESNIRDGKYEGKKTFYLVDGYYLLCETGSKSQDKRRYVQVVDGEMQPF